MLAFLFGNCNRFFVRNSYFTTFLSKNVHMNDGIIISQFQSQNFFLSSSWLALISWVLIFYFSPISNHSVFAIFPHTLVFPHPKYSAKKFFHWSIYPHPCWQYFFLIIHFIMSSFYFYGHSPPYYSWPLNVPQLDLNFYWRCLKFESKYLKKSWIRHYLSRLCLTVDFSVLKMLVIISWIWINWNK